MSKFNVGDIVTKTYGKKPAEITYLNSYGGHYNCRYLESRQTFYATDNELKLHTEETEMAADTKTLYSFTNPDGKVAYGTHIGTNSQNQYLIEEKTTGAIHVLEKKDLEEVVPYTFSASMGGKETHYVGTPGALSKGDVLLYTGSITPQVAVVTGVDTKNKSARAKFKGAKIVTEAI
jgi:transglutaminase/protease-like cytokinesis protein 3